MDAFNPHLYAGDPFSQFLENLLSFWRTVSGILHTSYHFELLSLELGTALSHCHS